MARRRLRSMFEMDGKPSERIATETEPVLLVGPRSSEEVTYGMSICFDFLIDGFVQRGLPHAIVDRSVGMDGRTVGALSLGGIFATLMGLLSFWRRLPQVGIVYIAIGTSTAGFLRDMLMIWSGWLLGKRLVTHLHGGGYLDFYRSRSFILKKTISSTFARVDAIVVLGSLLRDQFEFVSNVEARLRVVPNGLNWDLTDGRQSPKVLDRSGPLRLLYLSNMIPSKGYLDLLEACRVLRYERNIPIRCDFCGAFLATVNEDRPISPSDAEQEFRSLIKREGLEGIVHYHGTVRGKRKREMLKNAHLFLLPTAYPWEGQPVSIIEALAFGLPVVSTRYRGIPEQVLDGYNGFLIEEKSPKRIADAVEQVWNDATRYEQLSHNAVQHYRQHFTRDAHLNKLIPVILGQDVGQ